MCPKIRTCVEVSCFKYLSQLNFNAAFNSATEIRNLASVCIGEIFFGITSWNTCLNLSLVNGISKEDMGVYPNLEFVLLEALLRTFKIPSIMLQTSLSLSFKFDASSEDSC